MWSGDSPPRRQLLSSGCWTSLSSRQLLADGDVVNTHFLGPDDPVAAAVRQQGWASTVEHEAIDFLTWPYEWPFSMLQDAALLQLRLLETSLHAGWAAQGCHAVQHSMDR